MAVATVVPFGEPWAPILQLLGDDNPNSTTQVSLSDDPAAGSDALTVSATTTIADTGTGADAVTVAATTTVADTATAADAVTVSVATTVDDPATGVDAVTVTATVPLSDSGSGADTISGGSVTIDQNQAPYLVAPFGEPWAPVAQMLGAQFNPPNPNPVFDDPATAVDQITVNDVTPVLPSAGPSLAPMFLSPSDASMQMAGSQDPTGNGAPSVSDVITAAEAITVAASVALSDAASIVDAVSVTTGPLVSDTGTSSDALSATATLSVADTATATDSISVNTGGSNKSVSDSATATDAITVSVTTTVDDPATGVDAISGGDPNQGPAAFTFPYLYTPPTWRNVISMAGRGALRVRFDVSTCVYRRGGVWFNVQDAAEQDVSGFDVWVDPDDASRTLDLFFTRPTRVPGDIAIELMAVMPANPSWTPGQITPTPPDLGGPSVVFTDNLDGTWSATGLVDNPDGTWTSTDLIDNPDGTWTSP